MIHVAKSHRIHGLKLYGLKQAAVATGLMATAFAVRTHATPAVPIESTTKGVVEINPVTRNDRASAAKLTLAENGTAELPIIVSANASKVTRDAAQDLAQTLQKVTGAAFAVQIGDGSSGIVVGTIAEFPQPGLDKALEIRNGYDGREAYAIRTGPKRLLLLGATDLGASDAAYRFLNEVGCRWFFPNEAWEVLPKTSTLSFGRDITDRPQILARNIWFEAGSGNKELNDKYVLWRHRNRQEESFKFNAGHNMDTVIKVNKAAFDAHPEYLAAVKQKDGTLKRTGPQLELSNPAVRKMVDDYAVNYFVQNPKADMVSLDPADTWTHSESPESLAMGSVSDRVFGMVNEAARAVEKAYPGQGKMVGVLSYSAHWDPPSFPMEPNVHVQVSGLGQGKYSAAEREKMWPTLSRNLGFYEYYSVWLWSFDLLPGSWINDPVLLQKNLRARVAGSATAISAESTSTWASNGRAYYLATQLMWNPDIDVDAVLNDFDTKCFGAGAPAMKRYFERLNPGNKPLMSGHLLGLCFRDIDEASKATQDRPDIQARLDQLKMYLRYEQIIWMRDKEPHSGAEKAALTTAMMTSLFRTRGYALTSWEMTRENWGRNKYPGKDNEPWMVDKPLLHEEIEADFQDGLKHFAPKIRDLGPKPAFSDDVVPVAWPAALKGEAAPSEQFFQGTCRYALYSRTGEPLEFSTWAGHEWGGINRFTITDAKGKEIASGMPKKDTTEDHTIEVPRPGLYYLDYIDKGSTWAFHAEPGIVATLPMGQTQDYRNTRPMPDMYFYVPKGTKNIEYFYGKTHFQIGGPHQVVDPGGKVVQDVNVDGDYVSVPVPEGMDGKLWRLRNAVLGLYQFNNAPDNLAASPEALLIPRELAIKDGLAIAGK